MSHADGERLQTHFRDAVVAGEGPEVALLLEHHAVVTLGRSADDASILVAREWLAERGVDVAECDRGGLVTFHGPGQLVGYPIVDLKPDRRDVRRYVRDLEEVIIRTLAELGVSGEHSDGERAIGVWVGRRKIASIGVHLKRWVTSHGFALNLTTDLSYFAMMQPCGLDASVMTSVEDLTGERHEVEAVAELCQRHLGDVLGRTLVDLPDDLLPLEVAL